MRLHKSIPEIHKLIVVYIYTIPGYTSWAIAAQASARRDYHITLSLFLGRK